MKFRIEVGTNFLNIYKAKASFKSGTLLIISFLFPRVMLILSRSTELTSAKVKDHELSKRQRKVEA